MCVCAYIVWRCVFVCAVHRFHARCRERESECKPDFVDYAGPKVGGERAHTLLNRLEGFSEFGAIVQEAFAGSDGIYSLTKYVYERTLWSNWGSFNPGGVTTRPIRIPAFA